MLYNTLIYILYNTLSIYLYKYYDYVSKIVFIFISRANSNTSDMEANRIPDIIASFGGGLPLMKSDVNHGKHPQRVKPCPFLPVPLQELPG